MHLGVCIHPGRSMTASVIHYFAALGRSGKSHEPKGVQKVVVYVSPLGKVVWLGIV